MTKRELLRLQIRHLRLSAWDRLQDLWNITLPIFLTVGIIAASARFWWWVFWS